jgi:predicted transport protein
MLQMRLELYLGGKMQEQTTQKNLIKRVEILGEAAQTALEAILEIQAEQKLLTYLLLEKEPADEN